MKRTKRIVVVGTVVCMLLAAVPGAAAERQAAYRSPFDVVYSGDGKSLVVSDRTAGCLYVADVAGAKVTRTVKLQGQPMALALGKGSTVYVAQYDAGTVAEVDTASGKVLRRIAVGPKPVGVGVAADKNLLVVSDYGRSRVLLVDLNSGKITNRIRAGNLPYFVAVTADQSLAVVGNLIAAGPATDPMSSAVVTLIDLESKTKIKDIALPDGSSNVRHVAISPDGKWAYVPHTRGRVVLPTTQLERGWVNTNAVSIIDLGKKELHATVLLDTVAEGAANPWGVAIAPDAKTAYVTLPGPHQVAKIGLARMHELMAGAADIEAAEETDGGYSGPMGVWAQIKADAAKRELLAYDLSALYAAGLLKRIRLNTEGPQAVAVSPDGKAVAVAAYYAGEILLLDPDSCKVKGKVSLGPQPPIDDVRRGEMAFHDARYCFQHWLSCVTCHPDGRVDGLNWDLLNDGIGNPKNSRSLLWSHKTPPVMSLGVRESMEVAAGKGYRLIQFQEVDKEVEDATIAYLKSLQPEASPYLVKGQLSKKAQKGKAIFEDGKVGCVKCHAPPLYTSLKAYDVGTQHELDRTGTFDTPTCIELWRTGPYLHDGSAVTLKEMLTKHNKQDKHGATSHLEPAQIDALVEYLLSL